MAPAPTLYADTASEAPSTPFNVASAPDTDSEHTRAEYVRRLFYRARDARRPLIRQWKRNYRTLHSKTWAPRSESWMPSPEIAQVWPVVFSCVAWLTDQRPTIEVTPAAQPFSMYSDWYQGFADDMNVCLNATFVGNSLDGEVNKLLWDTYTYGIGYLKCTWEPWLADGIGDAAFRRVDPFSIYPDPFARNVSDLTYIIEAKIMTISDVDRAWPGAAARLSGGGMLEQTDEAPHALDETVTQTMPRVRLGNISPNTNTRYAISDKDRMTAVRDETVVTVLECWVREHDVTDTADDKVKSVRDCWQCIVVCGNTVLLDESAEDVNAFGEHPYSRMVVADTGEWYGVSLVELLDSPQESIGRLLTSIEQNIALMGNPVLKEQQNSPSVQKRLSNRPGARIPVRSTTDVEWLQPPQIAPQLAPQMIQFYKGEIESISGLSAMIRGFSPSGRNAQGVLDSVQDAAFVRVRATLRELERCLRIVCSKMCATIAEFYDEPRFMAQIGPDGQKTNLALRARHFYTRDYDDDNERIPLRFSLLADAGSQLPTSKQARAADASQLYAMGAIDVFELLKARQWPNYSVVAKRVMSQQASAGTLGQGPGQRQATRT